MTARSVRKLSAAGACAAAFAALVTFRSTGDTKAEPPAAAASGSLNFVVEPYLQFATRTSITVMCETAAPTTCVVEYGPTVPPALKAEANTPNTLHEVRLDGLQPNAKHFYRVVCKTADGQTLTSTLSTFTTAVAPTDAYSFAVVGDTQRNPAVTGQIAKLIWARRPHFVLHTGDVVDSGPAKWMWTGDLFQPCRELFARVPVYPCIGNHEKNDALYYRYFSLPAPEYHYSFRYGNAEFFSLDTNKPVGPGSEQYEWLDRALAKSDAAWKVCYHHHPCYSSDADDFGNTWKGHSRRQDKNAAQLVPLYEKHKVDLVLNGHIHLYERTWPVRGGKVEPKGGTVYLTTGGGGGKLEELEPTPAFFKNQGHVTYHYCYFTAHGGTLDGYVYDHEGRLFDRFTLRKE